MAEKTAQQSPHSHLGVPDPEWLSFYAKHKARVPQLEGSPEHLRSIMENLKIEATAKIPPIKGLTTDDVKVKASDGYEVPVRVYSPEGVTLPRPGFVYIHGGGWTLGDLEGEDIACRAICAVAKVIVVAMDYRLAPENPFPKGLEDCWDVLEWASSKSLISERSRLTGSRPSKDMPHSASEKTGFCLGDQVQEAAVLAHRARDRGIQLRGQILRIPATCHIDCYPPELQLYSMEELKYAPLLSKHSMELFYGYYNPPDPSSPEVSPLLNQNFFGLAPAYLQVAGLDPLRDEGLAYAEKLRESGVQTKLDIYPGLPHAFGYFPELSAALKISQDLINAIQDLTEREELDG
ncbi:alpha/beta hydrolase fold-domain-containing protein [Dactylonectria macrodidyma]|uniref:Alpha/beta hydrolase fold-domain-containing protein n=1 Tax=Dactylonectria macrodidyma TaxID=307937 RepID=A0A9P9J3G6_9HYPO|nr:alpha/beta hydrolase fold-domain-containing protein [Dactylonectria macrodidyma]